MEQISTLEFISISSGTGIIISFASTEIIGQIVAGFYLIFSRPFKVGDLIQIKSTTGIVTEIGIIYTKIQRIDGNIIKYPNKEILDSNFKNYTIRTTPEIKTRKFTEMTTQNEYVYVKKTKSNILQNFLQEISETIEENEITRFSFDFEIDLTVPPVKVKAKLKQICNEYTPVFGYRPKYSMIGTGFRLTVRFRIYCPHSQLIFECYPKLVSDIAEAIYGDGGK